MSAILILGAGVQGTLLGVRLHAAGHQVTLVARGRRAAQLRSQGAIAEHALTGQRQSVHTPVVEAVDEGTAADICFVTVRREQIDPAIEALSVAANIGRVVIMVNHANGSEGIFEALGRDRAVLAFPGIAGTLEDGIVRYVEVAQQKTVVDARAADVLTLLKGAGFSACGVADMDSWLRRHAVFVTAIGGALYGAGADTQRLGADGQRMREFILAVREGWAALDHSGIAPAPLALRPRRWHCVSSFNGRHCRSPFGIGAGLSARR